MIRTFIPSALLALALVMPLQDARAQNNTLGGALLGGVGGAVIGGAVGGGRGAVIGGVIGATAGAVIGSEGERRGAYYYHQRGCYAQRGDGTYVVVEPRYCQVAVAPGDGSAWCAQRYRSYDPVSGTYMSQDGYRRPCP